MIKILIFILILLMVKTIYDKLIGTTKQQNTNDSKDQIIDVDYEEVE